MLCSTLVHTPADFVFGYEVSGRPLDVLGNTDCIMLGLAQLGHHDARAKVEVGKRVRVAVSLSRERERQTRRERKEESGGGVRLESQRERQLICLGDDSPMLGIYSIRREGGRYVGVEEGRGKRFGRRPGQHHCTADREWWRERQRPQR